MTFGQSAAEGWLPVRHQTPHPLIACVFKFHFLRGMERQSRAAKLAEQLFSQPVEFPK